MSVCLSRYRLQITSGRRGPLPADVPDVLRSLADEMLDMDPDRRPSVADMLALPDIARRAAELERLGLDASTVVDVAAVLSAAGVVAEPGGGASASASASVRSGSGSSSAAARSGIALAPDESQDVVLLESQRKMQEEYFKSHNNGFYTWGNGKLMPQIMVRRRRDSAACCSVAHAE
jgi:hypothetical protein